MTDVEKGEQQLRQLEQRRAALVADLDAANTSLATAHQSLINAQPKALNTVTAEQARTTALAEAIRALEAQIEITRGELASARAEEAAEAHAERIQKACALRQEAIADYWDARSRLAAAIAGPTAEICDALSRFNHFSKEAGQPLGRMGNKGTQPEGVWTATVNQAVTSLTQDYQRRDRKLRSLQMQAAARDRARATN